MLYHICINWEYHGEMWALKMEIALGFALSWYLSQSLLLPMLLLVHISFLCVGLMCELLWSDPQPMVSSFEKVFVYCDIYCNMSH